MRKKRKLFHSTKSHCKNNRFHEKKKKTGLRTDHSKAIEHILGRQRLGRSQPTLAKS
jgi:hypothetical protein